MLRSATTNYPNQLLHFQSCCVSALGRTAIVNDDPLNSPQIARVAASARRIAARKNLTLGDAILLSAHYLVWLVKEEGVMADSQEYAITMTQVVDILAFLMREDERAGNSPAREFEGQPLRHLAAGFLIFFLANNADTIGRLFEMPKSDCGGCGALPAGMLRS